MPLRPGGFPSAHRDRIRAYPGTVTNNPPTEEPEQQRWQQPSFGPSGATPYETPSYGPSYETNRDGVTDDDPPPYGMPQQPVSGYVMPAPGTPIPPPSAFETVIGTLSKLVWPVAILLIIFAHLGFWPVLITAIVAGTILRAVKGNLRERRRAIGGPNHPRPPFS